MLITHRGVAPRIASSAYIAPTAVVCGDVEIGEDCRVLFGAVIAAEGAPVRIGARVVILENAVVRSWPDLPVTVGDDVHVGTATTVNGATLGADVYLAANVSIFPGAVVGARSIVRTKGIVHVNAVLPENRRVPDGWTAVGNPAQVLPPGEDERLIVSAEGLNFTRAVFGVDRKDVGTKGYVDFFAGHVADDVIDDGS